MSRLVDIETAELERDRSNIELHFPSAECQGCEFHSVHVAHYPEGDTEVAVVESVCTIIDERIDECFILDNIAGEENA